MTSLIAHLRPFQRLNDEECALVEDAGNWVRVPGGRQFITEQQCNDAMYVVARGSVNVRFSDSIGTSLDLAAQGPGMVIGEYSFVDGQPAAASAVAAEDSVLFMIGHRRLEEILEQNDRIGRIVYRNLLRMLVERLRAVNAELDLFGQ